MVRAEGFEPTSSFEHRHLKPACMPDFTTPAETAILRAAMAAWSRKTRWNVLRLTRQRLEGFQVVAAGALVVVAVGARLEDGEAASAVSIRTGQDRSTLGRHRSLLFSGLHSRFYPN